MYMKKIFIIMLSGIMIFMMSGCNGDNSASIDVVAPTTSTSTSILKETGEIAEEIDVQLQPGFETWEESEAVKALNNVLIMKEPVKVVTTQEANVGEADKQYYLNNIYHFLEYDFNQSMVPDQYGIVDLDHDGTPEVIVKLSAEYESWIMILRYYEGSVLGYSFVSRGFEGPKMDGTYMASSGAFDNKIMEISFQGINLEENCLGYSALLNDTWEYFIADNKVSEKEYNVLSDKYYNSEDMKWHLFPSNFRAGYNGEELFHVDFKGVTQPVVKELESYYSELEANIGFSHSSRIPQDLINIILEAMESGKEEETFGPLKEGTEISQEEFCELTGFYLVGTENVIPMKVDADNDGNQDLIGLYYWGGTGGFSSMDLYQGVKEGEYKLTSSVNCMYQKYNFISFQGKNYLLMEDFDYNTKYYSGYTLYLYHNGVLADGMSFKLRIQDYEMIITYENSSFNGIEQIKNTLCNKGLSDILNNNEGVIDGTGEIIDESKNENYGYSSDIDNDGDPEYYYKSMWYPSNMGTVMQCFYDFEDSNVLEDLCARLAEEIGEGRLYTFWVDKVNDKNILYLYFGNNFDYSLYAYLIKGTE